MDAKYKNLTEQIIRAFYTVYNTLGYGFLEKVYEDAMVIELRKLGLKGTQQSPIIVYYESQEVGHYDVDLLVEDAVIVELKATRDLAPEHEAQLLNYPSILLRTGLKATPFEVGLILNFGPEPRIKRKTFDNELKGSLRWLRDTDEHK